MAADVVLVNFTVMRVVSALFLKQTMAIAHIDEERLAMAKMKEHAVFAAELRMIFEEADGGEGEDKISHRATADNKDATHLPRCYQRPLRVRMRSAERRTKAVMTQIFASWGFSRRFPARSNSRERKSL